MSLYGVCREHKMTLGEWLKTTSDVASMRRVTDAKLHIVADTLNAPEHRLVLCPFVTRRKSVCNSTDRQSQA